MENKKISSDRLTYLKKRKKQKLLVFVTQVSILIIGIGLWETLANIGVIDSFITSKPSRIWSTFMNLSSNGLLKHLGITLLETTIGFISGTILGILIAILLWWSKFLSKVMEPYLVVLNSLPKIALRSGHYYLGRSRNASYYCNGIINITYCYNIRKFKWFFKHR